MRRVLLFLLLWFDTVPARRIFAHLLHGTNCTARLHKDECIVNPLFMQDQCPGECDHLQYVDMLPECSLNLQGCYGRNNEGSYFVRRLCNASCREHFLEVEESLAPNDAVVLLHAVLPPLYALAFVMVVLLQLLTGPWADPLMVWLERRRASSWAAYAQAGVLRLGERPETRGAARHVGRLFVCGYFVVEGGLLFGGLAVLAFALPRRLRFATYGLLLYSAAEAFSVVANVTLRMAVTGQFHMNELMVKKASLLGVLVLFQAVPDAPSAAARQQALPGAEVAERSLFLEARVLAARLMMASLFAFVGYIDMLRILRGQVHDPPDGHDVLWPKVVEFVLVLPFLLGFKTGTVSQLLAASLVLEAMTAWTYWREQTQDIPSLYHSIHSKDHFATNVAVAGGLLLLQHDGGGKYTLDSYLKKKD